MIHDYKKPIWFVNSFIILKKSIIVLEYEREI